MENKYNELSTPLPAEAIQRTKASDTRKGYDTTGYAYQYVVNRLNDVLGIGGWSCTWEVINVVEGKYASGKGYWDITANVTITIGDASMSMPGGHVSANYADALKGAITNGFKKCAAMYGIGREAYEGTIDDDNRPLPPDHGQETEVIQRKVIASDKAKVSAVLSEIGELMGSLGTTDREAVKKIVFKNKNTQDIKAMPLEALLYARDEIKRYGLMIETDLEGFWTIHKESMESLNAK